MVTILVQHVPALMVVRNNVEPKLYIYEQYNHANMIWHVSGSDISNPKPNRVNQATSLQRHLFNNMDKQNQYWD